MMDGIEGEMEKKETMSPHSPASYNELPSAILRHAEECLKRNRTLSHIWAVKTSSEITVAAISFMCLWLDVQTPTMVFMIGVTLILSGLITTIISRSTRK